MNNLLTLNDVISLCNLLHDKKNNRWWNELKGDWSGTKVELSECQKVAFVKLIGTDCSEDTRKCLRRFIDDLNQYTQNHEVFSRIKFSRGTCFYYSPDGQELEYDRLLICNLICDQNLS